MCYDTRNESLSLFLVIPFLYYVSVSKWEGSGLQNHYAPVRFWPGTLTLNILSLINLEWCNWKHVGLWTQRLKVRILPPEFVTINPMILLEFTLYLTLLIIDASVLFILQTLNPYYGINSPSYALKIVDAMTELQNANPNDMSGVEYFKFTTDRVKIAHYCAWNIIVNG